MDLNLKNLLNLKIANLIENSIYIEYINTVNMSLKSNFNKEGDYLLIETEGKCEHNEAVSLLRNIKKRCNEENYKKLLIDIYNVDFSGLQTIDRFDLGDKIAELFVNPHVKIAVIINPDKVDNFTKNVARNRFAYIEYFKEKTKALEWLKE